MKLYIAEGSPNCRKVQITAHELGMELDIQSLDVLAGAHRRPEFLQLNPNGKVPALTDGDFWLWESNAIMQYLANHRGESPLWPRDPRARADVSRWQCWELAHFGNLLAIVLFERVFFRLLGQAGDEARAKDALARWQPYAQVLEQQLERQPYVTGAQPTLADFSLAVELPLCEVGRVDLSPFPAMRAWLDRLNERPSFRATVMPESMATALGSTL